jgi:hypothetical protein
MQMAMLSVCCHNRYRHLWIASAKRSRPPISSPSTWRVVSNTWMHTGGKIIVGQLLRRQWDTPMMTVRLQRVDMMFHRIPMGRCVSPVEYESAPQHTRCHYRLGWQQSVDHVLFMDEVVNSQDSWKCNFLYTLDGKPIVNCNANICSSLFK